MVHLKASIPHEIEYFVKDLSEVCYKHEKHTILYLVGSYATTTYTTTSDLDFLIICPKKRVLAQQLASTLHQRYPRWFSKLDCKILSKKDIFQAREKHYLFLYSLLSTGKLLMGDPIPISYSRSRLEAEYLKIAKSLQKIVRLVEKRIAVEIQLLASTIFTWGKSLVMISRILTKSKRKLKDVFVAEFDFLKKHYDQLRAEHPSIQLKLTKRKQLKVLKNKKLSQYQFTKVSASLISLQSVVRELKSYFNLDQI